MGSRRGAWEPLYDVGMMRFIPFAILAAAAGWLASRWSEVPERWVSHWGPGGVPNGWSTKSFSGAFGPFLFAAGLAVFLEIMAMITERVTRARVPALARPYGDFVRGISVALAGSIAIIAAVLPSPTPPSSSVFTGLLFGSLALALVAGGARVVAETRRMRARPG
jgi:uncharacterized protein DUF1648